MGLIALFVGGLAFSTRWDEMQSIPLGTGHATAPAPVRTITASQESMDDSQG